MPVLFEGGRILPEIETPNLTQQTPLWAWSIISLLAPLAPFLPFVIVSAVLLGVSFYASTLARNTLQAIAPAILGIVMIGVLVFGAETISGSHNPPWRGPLIYLFGVPVLALTLAGFAYWNFKRVLVGWPVWRRNLITFLAALIGVMVVTTAVYHRAWELCLRLEPTSVPSRRSSSRSTRTRAAHKTKMVAVVASSLPWISGLSPVVSWTQPSMSSNNVRTPAGCLISPIPSSLAATEHTAGTRDLRVAATSRSSRSPIDPDTNHRSSSVCIARVYASCDAVGLIWRGCPAPRHGFASSRRRG
jgi:hypothetical protein